MLLSGVKRPFYSTSSDKVASHLQALNFWHLHSEALYVRQCPDC
jgi:hypothetical protein